MPNPPDNKTKAGKRVHRELRERSRRFRPLRIALVWAAVVALLIEIDATSGLFTSIESLSMSMRTRLWAGRNADIVQAAQKQIVLVPFTQATFQDPSFNTYKGLPVARSYYPRVIDELNRAGAKVIVFDMLFDASRPGDDQFAAAARRFGNVVWGCFWDNDSNTLLKPNPLLYIASPHIGHAASPYEDEGSTIDRVQATIDDDGQAVPALSVEAALMALGDQDATPHLTTNAWNCGKLTIPLDHDGRFRIRFFGEPSETLAEVPFDQVYHGIARTGMFRDQGFFKNKIVLIGDRTPLSPDIYLTPVGRMSGLEAHAFAIETLMQGSYLRDLPPWTGLLFVALLAALSAWFVSSRRWLHAFLLTAAALLGYVLAAFFVFVAFNLVVPIAAPVMTALAVGIGSMFERGWTEERERARIVAVLRQYVSQQVSEHGPPTGEVALLFTDIEGSTDMSKRFGERFERVRDEHFRILRGAAQLWNGFEVETAGDSIYIVFGRASDAVRFSIDAQRDLGNHEWPPIVGNVRVRMGIHYGQPFVGRDRSRLTYRGPDTNKAARVMGSAQGGQVLVTDEVCRAASRDLPDNVSFLDVGSFGLKGIGDETLFQVCHPDLRREFAGAPLKY